MNYRLIIRSSAFRMNFLKYLKNPVFRLETPLWLIVGKFLTNILFLLLDFSTSLFLKSPIITHHSFINLQNTFTWRKTS